jgi:integrase
MPEVEMMDEPEKEPVYMLPEHFDAIYRSCEFAAAPLDRPYSAADWWRALLLTGLMTGMRINVMLTLPWDDTHLDDGYVVLRHHRTKGKRDDVIPLHPVVVDHVRKITDLGRLVFDWPAGYDALLDEFHRIQRAAGIDLPCHETHKHTATCHVYGFHSLKKACGTLNAARLPEKVLNAFMRHSSVETTRRYYQNKQRILDGHVESMYVPNVAKQVDNFGAALAQQDGDESESLQVDVQQ